MGRPCVACGHAAHLTIDKALIQKQPLATLALKYKISPAALARHAKAHVLAKPIAAVDLGGDDFESWQSRVRLETPDDVLTFAKLQLYRMERLVDKAEADGDLRTAMAGVSATLKSVGELFAKTSGLLVDGPRVDASTKIVAVLSGLSEEQLRAFFPKSSTTALPS